MQKKTCSSKRALKVHIIIVHDKIKNYQCEDCDQSFYAKAHLKRHVTRIHYDQKVKCNECSVMFGLKSNMERHVSSVHKSIKHKCSECQRGRNWWRVAEGKMLRVFRAVPPSVTGGLAGVNSCHVTPMVRACLRRAEKGRFGRKRGTRLALKSKEFFNMNDSLKIIVKLKHF